MTEAEREAGRLSEQAPQGPVGEAACALHRVCEACGHLEDGPPAPVCPRCGTARSG